MFRIFCKFLTGLGLDGTQAQEEGEWRDHPYFDGVKVLVRSISSEAYRKRQTALQNRLPRRTRKTGDAIAAQLEIDRQARDVLVAGWTGIDDAEYSEETAREWAKDPKFRRFFDGVYELSLDIGMAEHEHDETVLGN